MNITLPPAPPLTPSRGACGVRSMKRRKPAAARARPEKLNAWLSPGYRARLTALTASDHYTVGEWIETWIELSERDLRKAKKPS